MATTDFKPDTKPGDEPTAGPPPATSTPAPSARRGDPPPRRKSGGQPGPRPGRRKTAAKGAAKTTTKTGESTASTAQLLAREDQKLVANLTKLLELPVVPSRAAGFAFGVAHFSEQARPSAELIVKASRDWPELRHALTNADALVSGKVLLAVGIVAYVGPVIAYTLGQQNLAFAASPASVEQVQAIDLMLSLPPDLAAAVAQAQREGMPEGAIAAMIERFYAQSAQQPGSPAGSGPPAPGTATATPTN